MTRLNCIAANDQAKAAGTGKRHHWRPTPLSPSSLLLGCAEGAGRTEFLFYTLLPSDFPPTVRSGAAFVPMLELVTTSLHFFSFALKGLDQGYNVCPVLELPVRLKPLHTCGSLRKAFLASSRRDASGVPRDVTVSRSKRTTPKDHSTFPGSSATNAHRWQELPLKNVNASSCDCFLAATIPIHCQLTAKSCLYSSRVGSRCRNSSTDVPAFIGGLRRLFKQAELCIRHRQAIEDNCQVTRIQNVELVSRMHVRDSCRLPVKAKGLTNVHVDFPKWKGSRRSS